MPINITPQPTQIVDGSAVTQPVSGTVSVSGTVPVSGTVAVSAVSGNVATTGADGSQATIGTTTDASSANTLVGLLKKLISLLPTALSGSGSLKVSVTDSAKLDVTAATVPVSGTFWQTTQAVSGTVATTGADGSQATIGTTTDASSANTLVGLLKKLVSLLPTALVGSRLGVDIGGGTGTVQNAQTAISTTSITANAQRISVACANYATAIISFKGTSGTVAGSFFGSDDGGTTWYAWPVMKVAATPTFVAVTGTLVAGGQLYMMNCAGLTHLSWLSTTFTSGVGYVMNTTLTSQARDLPSYAQLVASAATQAVSGTVAISTVGGAVTIAHGKTVKTAVVNLNTSAIGDNTIVAAVSSKRLKVSSWYLLTSSADIRWKDGASTDLTGTFPSTATNTPFGQNTTTPDFLFATTAGNALILNSTTADYIQGYVTYWDDDAT